MEAGAKAIFMSIETCAVLMHIVDRSIVAEGTLPNHMKLPELDQ